MHKNIKALLLTALMVSTFTVTTFATTKQQGIEEQQKIIQNIEEQKKETKSKLNQNLTLEQQAEKKVQDLEAKIELMDSQISDKQIRIDEANNSIARTNENISKSQLELDKAQLDMEKEQEVFGQRASALYMNGTGSYIQLLLESDGFFDLISRIQTLKDISEHDNNIMKELAAKKETVQSKQKSLQVEKNRLISLKEQNEKDLATILEDKKALNIVVAKATEERNYFASISKSYRDKQKQNENSIANAKKTIENWKQYGSPKEPARGFEEIPASEFGRRVVVEAYKYMGTPYVWGGTRPSPGFDCSGFVQYVYRRLGVTLTRTTYTQIEEGHVVSRGNLQPGDIIFFGSARSPGHVGIYVGNNSYIHAPHTGDVIKISSLSSRNYAAARRIK